MQVYKVGMWKSFYRKVISKRWGWRFKPTIICNQSSNTMLGNHWLLHVNSFVSEPQDLLTTYFKLTQTLLATKSHQKIRKPCFLLCLSSMYQCSLVNNVALFIFKEKVEAEERKQQKEKEKKDAAQMLKKSIIISAMVVAVAGAIFVLNKKSREKWTSKPGRYRSNGKILQLPSVASVVLSVVILEWRNLHGGHMDIHYFSVNLM